jgi:hypothetical protein
MLAPSDVERFWSKVDKSDACWVWTGMRNDSGYGLFILKGRYLRAHRIAFQLTSGNVPQGICVCHHCDNPPCVRPDHLFLGTVADNNADMVAKGRNRNKVHLGEQNGQSKLTSKQVDEIRFRYAAGGITQRELARQYGVSNSLIGHIVTRRFWRDGGSA